ncbi:BsaA family SipW-dependent biofilm matrix protein [Clostridium baratii]|uniref:BsaA family SipW-dependent biofilm matrix protein n=1 Tax=Clostridium baratii TaxID=1561 RepID=UPI001C2504F6|nr:BsaA family SipW-dependent biofilm matrix protein [Clostridium baratii]
MKKKKLSLLIGVGILTVALIGGTLAWFTSKDNVTNKFTTGSIKHEILEKFEAKNETHENILPGDEINKDVWIKNTGKSDALLRVKIRPVWVDGNTETDASGQVKLNFTDSVKEGAEWIGGENVEWIKIGDYYYYNKVLKAENTDGNQITSDNNGYIEGEVPESLANCYTSQLLDSVTFNAEVKQTEGDTTGYQDKKLDIKVESETVQVTNGAYIDEWKVETDSNKEDIKSLVSSIIDKYGNRNSNQ